MIAGIIFPPLSSEAQEIRILSGDDLAFGAYIKGLCHLAPDDESGLYLKEANGSLIAAPFDSEDGSFYFWMVENAFTAKFQLFSGREGSEGKPLQIQASGNTQFASSNLEASSQLLFQMYPEGTARDIDDTEILSRGFIITQELDNPANASCQCNILSVDGNNHFKVIDAKSNFVFNEYSPTFFEKVKENISGSVIEEENYTRINQEPLPGTSYQNYVSSKLQVNGFGADDFQVTIQSGTKGSIGFLHYFYHGYTRQVFTKAKPEIGLKVENDKISLFYLNGSELLPSGRQKLKYEVATDFLVGLPITFGFKNQDTLVAQQEDKTFFLYGTAPTDFFLNESITQSARMLVQLNQGTIDIAHTTKNNLLASSNNRGTLDGAGLISTNPYFPYNSERDLVNTFDWQKTQWDVRYRGDNGLVEDRTPSPYHQIGADFVGITAKYNTNGDYIGGEDFSSSEGWELIKAHLGYLADGTPILEPPVHPYVMMYDRIAGILRVFVYINNQGEANQLNIGLRIDPGVPNNAADDEQYSPKLWGSLQQFQALDQVVSSSYNRTIPFFGGPGRRWYLADFVMEYDPCIAFFESSIELEVTKTTQGDLAMVGRLEGGSIPAGTPEYDNWKANKDNFLLGVMDNNFGDLQNTLGDVTFNQYKTFDVMDFSTEATGNLVGLPIEEWEKAAAKLEWEGEEGIANAEVGKGRYQVANGSAQIAEGVGKLIEANALTEGIGKAVQGVAKIARGLATMGIGLSSLDKGKSRLKVAEAKKKYYYDIKDKEKHSDQEINLSIPSPRPQVVFGEIALKGTLSIETALIDKEVFIATPGGKNSENTPEFYINGSRGSASLYNKPMGKFSLLKAPVFGLSVVHNDNLGYAAYFKTKEKPYIAHNNEVLGKIDDVCSIGFYVETFDLNGLKINGEVGGSYTNMFLGGNDANPLPGEEDISNLIDWDQIAKNIANGGNINVDLHKWVKISYLVSSFTITNTQARNLSRVFASGDNFYTGSTTFTYHEVNVDSKQKLKNKAIEKAASNFNNYTFSNHETWGENYNIYHTSLNFEDLMQSYCENLNGGPALAAKAQVLENAAEEPETLLRKA